MIRDLTLKDVGPARTLAFDFAPRLNVFTGDNGLGKTFVLDVLWWVLTTTWAGEKAFPWRPPADWSQRDSSGKGTSAPDVKAVIKAKVQNHDGASLHVRSAWQEQNQEWDRRPPRTETKRPPGGLVVYARIDGSYAVWDASYVKGERATFAEAAIILRDHEIWDGQEVADPEVQGGKRTVIGGLISDWASWQQRARSDEFEALRRVLQVLSPPDEPLVPGEPTRVHLRDRRDIPTLAMPYGVVPVTLASAGVRRTLSLAYLLVWAWTEHEKAAKQRRQRPTRDVVLLIDEPELHLHPAWQRVFLPAVLRAVGTIAPNAAVQVFTATHSPMVLASLESIFSEALDDLFVLSRQGPNVRADELPFGKEGDVSNWLASEVFGHVGGRPREAALAIDAAMAFMADRQAEAKSKLAELHERLRELPAGDPGWLKAAKGRPLVKRIHDALKQVLPGHDEFWVQWTLTYRPTNGRPRGHSAPR